MLNIGQNLLYMINKKTNNLMFQTNVLLSGKYQFVLCLHRILQRKYDKIKVISYIDCLFH